MTGCTLRLPNAKSSTLQENDPDVAITHESYHPHERERTRREQYCVTVVLYPNELGVKASISRIIS